MENKEVIKNCKKCKQDFILDSNDLGFYQKMKVPAPKVCPDCRFKIRALFRNETTLYTGRKCAMCKKSVISVFNPKSPYIVYCQSCYYSDKWDPYEYAIEYDSNKPFLEQLNELLKRVPKAATFMGQPNINSEYTNLCGGNKDCYLLFNSSECENVLYSRGLEMCRDSMDIYFGTNIQNCYETINNHESSGVAFSQNSFNDLDSWFLHNTKGCNNCFGCVNLRHGSSQFLNNKISKEKYKNMVEKIKGSYKETEKFEKQFNEFKLKFPVSENNNIHTVDSLGDYLFECKNVILSFECTNCENCKYCFSTKIMKDSYDIIGRGIKSELLLEGVAVGDNSSRIIGCYGVGSSNSIEYSFELRLSKDCFGCDGLKSAKNCILNKQYSKEEYESLREKIIKELEEQDLYGLMMPPEIAPFAYNETIAQENFPLTKEEAIAQGFRWEDDIQKTEGKETIQPENIPDNIKDVEDSIISEILRCIDCKRNYKITEQEFLFYKKIILPIPRKCFYCRHKDRVIRRGPYKFWNRDCVKCHKEITTNYAPERPEIIYCEKCYQQEVY